MQHHYHGEANTVIFFPFSTLAGTFSSGDRDKAHFHQEKRDKGWGGCWGRGMDSIFVFSFFCPTLILFHLMTTKLPTWHAEIHLGYKLSLLTKHAGFCRFILLFFEVPLNLQVLFEYFCLTLSTSHVKDGSCIILLRVSPSVPFGRQRILTDCKCPQ